MTKPPYQFGDFVWCNYPQIENPVSPGPEHVGYVAVTGIVTVNKPFATTKYVAMVAYTSSQPWNEPTPPGVRTFSRDEAQTMGQDRAFYIDLRREAFLPITADWFPRLNEPDRGVLGRATAKLRQELQATAETIYRRSPQNMEELGPFRPRRK